MDRKTAKVLGYDVDLLSLKEVMDYVSLKLENDEGMQIVTINPEIIETANQNLELASIIKNSELVVPDGAGIELALRLKKIVQERVPGIDLAKELINTCCMMNYPVALIGAKEEVLQRTCSRLEAEFKGLNITFLRNGYFTRSREDEIIRNLANS